MLFTRPRELEKTRRKLRAPFWPGREDTMTLRVFTANRVTDGVVVYLDEDDRWTESFGLVAVIADDETLARKTAAAEAAAAAAVVVDPYAIDVTGDGGDIRPVRYRERIRAFGPPVHPAFAKPSVQPKGT